jgi:hypothetical protein
MVLEKSVRAVWVGATPEERERREQKGEPVGEKLHNPELSIIPFGFLVFGQCHP